MSALVPIYGVRCDGTEDDGQQCKRKERIESWSMTAASREFRKREWRKTSKGGHLCPRHAKAAKKKGKL